MDNHHLESEGLWNCHQVLVLESGRWNCHQVLVPRHRHNQEDSDQPFASSAHFQLPLNKHRSSLQVLCRMDNHHLESEGQWNCHRHRPHDHHPQVLVPVRRHLHNQVDSDQPFASSAHFQLPLNTHRSSLQVPCCMDNHLVLARDRAEDHQVLVQELVVHQVLVLESVDLDHRVPVPVRRRRHNQGDSDQPFAWSAHFQLPLNKHRSNL
jgi:hypothetical protein